jgi:hypothetical protein
MKWVVKSVCVEFDRMVEVALVLSCLSRFIRSRDDFIVMKKVPKFGCLQ